MEFLRCIGLYLTETPVNGLPFNQLPGYISSFLELVPGENLEVKELIGRHCHKVELETFHAEKVTGDDKQLIKEARFYFHNVDEPLVLQPTTCSPRNLHKIEQLFRRDDETNELSVVDNPYFPDATTDEVVERLIQFYLALLLFTGDTSERNIKVVSFDVETGKFQSTYGGHLHEKYINLIEKTIDEKVTADRDAFIDTFIQAFAPGMASKVVKRLFSTPTTSNGAVVTSSEHTLIPWDDEALSKPFIASLDEMSPASVKGPNPRKVSHRTRIEFFIENFLSENFPIQPPFTKAEHGLDADTWDAFFATGESFAYKRRYTDFILSEIEKREWTLGDVLGMIKQNSDV